MGLPARKIDAEPVRPPLRLVPQSTRSARRDDRASASEGECRALFIAVTFAFVVLTVFGLARVALTAELTRASFDSGVLRDRIKSERQITEQLEADRSALLTPSRIEGIASTSMKMTQPKNVRYLRIGKATKKTKVSPKTARATMLGPSPGASKLSGAVATVMDLAADEAKALLAGDVGLASSR